MALPRYLTTVTPLSKTIALILFTLLPILGFIFGMRYQSLLTLSNNKPGVVVTDATPTSSTSQLPPPFPLDDQSARYYIRKNVLYYQTKDKPKNPTGIYISKDTTISYTQFEGRDITVKGRFVLEREEVQCIQAPCPPQDMTVIHLDSVTLK